jgi:hypothetical protein
MRWRVGVDISVMMASCTIAQILETGNSVSTWDMQSTGSYRLYCSEMPYIAARRYAGSSFKTPTGGSRVSALTWNNVLERTGKLGNT